MLWLGRKKKDSKVSKEVLLFKLEKKESVEDKDELLEFLKMLVCGWRKVVVVEVYNLNENNVVLFENRWIIILFEEIGWEYFIF